ncbi:MAG: aspartate/glutamate racemase family protein [Betaproteobacteria bacterium]
MLGILTLDTAFPRVQGDVGCARTFEFPVRYATPQGADPERIVHGRDDAMLPAFIDAARTLVDAGAIGIATTCGFLARWQHAFAEALDVPVLTSALLQAALVQRTLPIGGRVGVVTYSAGDLTPAVVAGAGLPPSTPIVGVDPGGVFARTIRHGAASLDREAMAADVVAAARRLVDEHDGIRAIVLECANMPPYAAEVRATVDLPVYDAAGLVAWFYSGLVRTAAPREGAKLW